MPSYKHESAQAWLQQYIAGLGYQELLQEAKNLATHLDNDTIQDIYQSDMDADGFFTDLDARPEGYEVHHDIGGYFIVGPGEEDPDEAGYSLGFDGRPHFETEEEAWTAAREVANA
jgi:hypothetical protein